MSKLKFACHLFLFRYGIIKRILTHPLLSFSDLHRESVVFRTEFANRYGCLPHFAFTQCFQLFVQFLTIVGFGIAVDGNLGFVTGLHALIQFLYNRLDSIVRWAVVEQLAYIQSIPFFANNGINDWVSSSTVSLNASDGVWPFSRNTSY